MLDYRISIGLLDLYENPIGKGENPQHSIMNTEKEQYSFYNIVLDSQYCTKIQYDKKMKLKRKHTRK